MAAPDALTIIGVDPGLACGFAYLHLGERPPLSPSGERLRFWSDDLERQPACELLERLLRRDAQAIVAVERFTFTGQAHKRTRQYDALYFIGVAEYLCTKYTRQLWVQGAADAQRTGSPDVLRALGWWSPGKDDRNKAAAQVAHALMRAHPKEFARMRGPGIIN